MTNIARGQTNTPSILNWFITVNGVLTNAAEVGFRVLDISGGLPGTQVFPVADGTYENVHDTAGRYGDGSYYAFDADAETGWTPSLLSTLGTHRIVWRWKITAGASYQTSNEDFEIVVESAGSTADPAPTDTYITLADIRALGLDSSVASDASVIAAIATWQAFLERATRQWFQARQLVLAVDGTDSDTLHFGVPIISVEYLKLNGDVAALDATMYKVYSSRTYPRDRQNPRIKLVSNELRDIYTAPLSEGRLKFRKGRQNQEIKGVFGYVEADGSTPPLIVRALTKLVVEKLSTPVYNNPSSPLPLPPPLLSGSLKEEWTDGHRLVYSTAPIGERKPGLTGITSDQEILDIIRLYKAPIGCATPAHPSYA